MTAPEPPAEQEAGYASTGPTADAGSSSAAGRGKLPAAGTVSEEPGAAGRAAWRKAISDLHARQARGRVRAKSQRAGPGMLRKPPPGEGT